MIRNPKLDDAACEMALVFDVSKLPALDVVGDHNFVSPCNQDMDISSAFVQACHIDKGLGQLPETIKNAIFDQIFSKAPSLDDVD